MLQCLTESCKIKWVKKAWGGEKWFVNNELYCAKYLFLLPGFQCSLHRHLVKDETFLVRQGEVTVEHGEESNILAEGESQRIKPGTWHRFANHGKGVAIILEASTHHDDLDVQRREPSRRITMAADLEKTTSTT